MMMTEILVFFHILEKAMKPSFTTRVRRLAIAKLLWETMQKVYDNFEGYLTGFAFDYKRPELRTLYSQMNGQTMVCDCSKTLTVIELSIDDIA